jgi:endogenous inhibitor of DNA gyrase (YacG/DUF329 family)
MNYEKTPSCPLCDAPLTYENTNDTHMYTCPDCPFIGFEYWKAQDAVNITHKLNNK